jgi:hypothetical protein
VSRESERFLKMLQRMDYKALTLVERLIVQLKATKEKAHELQTTLQDEWDNEHPNGIDGKRRIFRVEDDGTVHVTDVRIH